HGLVRPHPAHQRQHQPGSLAGLLYGVAGRWRRQTGFCLWRVRQNRLLSRKRPGPTRRFGGDNFLSVGNRPPHRGSQFTKPASVDFRGQACDGNSGVRARVQLLAVGLLLFTRASSFAESPAIKYLLPSGVAPGQATEVTLFGAELGGATSLWTSCDASAELLAR